MKTKILILGTIIAFALSLSLINCGKDEERIVIPPQDLITVKAVSAPPDTQDIINDPAWDNVEEVSLRVGDDKAYTDHMGIALVKTKAISDGVNLYMRFSWRDNSLSERPGRWFFEDEGASLIWSQRPDTVGTKFIISGVGLKQYELNNQHWENEDMLAIIFDYGNNGSEKANCATSCHYPDTNEFAFSHWPTGGGNMDAWVWRAGRTNPLGLADDQFWTDSSKDDSRTIPSHKRNAGIDNVSEPKFMHTLSANYDGSFLFSSDTTALELAGQDWKEREDGIPGYILERNWAPSGANTSRYDVRAKAQYDDVADRWTIVLWRKLQAPHAEEDVTFTAGNQYQATLAIANHVMRRHSGTKPFTIKF